MVTCDMLDNPNLTSFGDMVPDKSFVVNKGSWWEYSKTIFSISYLIIGE